MPSAPRKIYAVMPVSVQNLIMSVKGQTLTARFVTRDFRWLQFVEDFDIIRELEGLTVLLKVINGKCQY